MTASSRNAALVLAAVATLLAATGTAAGPAPASAVGALPPPVRTPDLVDPSLAELWRESDALERAGRLAESIARREQILERLPDDVHTHWRIARTWVRIGEALPGGEEGKLSAYQAARRWARRSVALDPDCPECCLYDFLSTVRIATASGVLRTLSEVRAAGPILDRCLGRPPTWSDGGTQAEAGNLHYAAAVFYRLVPDSMFAGLTMGRRGDLRTAARHARRAVEITPGRIDYQVELGTALLCRSIREGDLEAGREGRRALELARSLPRSLEWDGREQQRASALLAAPGGACKAARDVRVE